MSRSPLAFEEKGSGIPVVFLHAFPLSRHMWDAQASVLSKNFRFITIDLPGFGESRPTNEIETMDQMAADVVATLESELKIKDNFIVAGLSMGGYVLMRLLAQFPAKVRAAAFISTRSAPDTEEGKQRRFQNIEFVKKEGMKAFADKMIPALVGKSSLAQNSPAVAQTRALIETQNPVAVCAALRGMASRPDSTSVVKEFSKPCLFVAGKEDSIIPASEMESLAASVKNAEFHAIEGAGHLVSMEKPAPFNDLFLHFLKRRVL